MGLNVGDIWLLLGADLSGFRRGLSEAEGAAGASGGIIGAAFATAIGIGLEKAVSALMNAMKDAAEAIFNYQKNLDTLSVSFTTLLGSADAAAVFMERLKDFDGSNLFGLDKMADASKKMLAFGWAANSVIPDLTAIGNATAALGLNAGGMDRIIVALGQMRIKASVSAEEIRQLINANLNVLPYLEKAFGITGAQMKDLSKTGVTGMQAVDAIIKGMANDPKFVGMMASMQTSVSGATSVMENQLKQMGAYVTDGLFAAFKDTFVNIVTEFSKVKKQLTSEGIASFFNTGDSKESDKASSGMENLMQLSPQWTARIAGIGDTLLQVWDIAEPIFEKLGGIAMDALGVVCDAFLLIKPALDVFIQVMGIWYNFVVDRLGSWVTFAGDCVAYLQQGWNDMALDWANACNSIINELTWMVNGISEGLDYVLTGGGLWAEGWANISTGIGDVFASLKDWCLRQITEMVNGLLEKLGPVGGLIKNLASAGYSAFSSLATFIGSTFAGSIDNSTKSGNRFLDLLKKIDTTRKAFDRKKGEQELADNKGAKGLDPGDTAKKGASKKDPTNDYQKAVDKFEDKANEMWLSFSEKIAKMVDTDLAANLMGVVKDVVKANDTLDQMEEDIQNNAAKYDAKGIDRSALLQSIANARKSIADYSKVATDKYNKDNENALKSYAAKAASINASIAGDHIQKIQTEYDANKLALDKEAMDLRRTMGNNDEVNSYIAAKYSALQKQKEVDTSAAKDTIMQEEIDKNTFLYAQGQISAKQLNDITRTILEARLTALQVELQAEGLSADRIIELRKKIAATSATKDSTTGSTVGEQAADAIKAIQAQTLSAKDVITNCWSEIGSTITSTLDAVFTGSKSLGEGIRGIFLDISNSIVKMMLNIVIQAAILTPLKNSFTSLVGNWFPTAGATKKASGGATSAGEMVRWNEAGDEYFISGKNGAVIPHNVVQKLNSAANGSGGTSRGGSIVNQYISTPNADSFRRSQSQMLADASLAVRRGGRNL